MSYGNPFKTTQPRQFLIGAVGTLVVFGGFLGFRWVTHEDRPLPSRWLTETEQEELADALTQFDGWAAGCLWENRDFRDIADVVDESEGQTTLWRAENHSGREMSFLTVQDAEGSGDMDEVAGSGYFCYVPE